ncbi:hypothetical protein ACJX0J_020641, partial [Zea mays]
RYHFFKRSSKTCTIQGLVNNYLELFTDLHARIMHVVTCVGIILTLWYSLKPRRISHVLPQARVFNFDSLFNQEKAVIEKIHFSTPISCLHKACMNPIRY